MKAEFDSGDLKEVHAELRQIMADNIRVVDFHHDERRLEETFMEMVRANSPTHSPLPGDS